MKRRLYNFLSPTALTLILGIAAVQLPYYKFRTIVVLLVAVLAQGIVGYWLKTKKVTVPWVKVLRLVIIPILFLPTLYLDSYSTVLKNRITMVFLGDYPRGISELKVEEDIWTDYMIEGHFHANPDSMKTILNNGKFEVVDVDGTTRTRSYSPKGKKQDVSHYITASSDYATITFFYARD